MRRNWVDGELARAKFQATRFGAWLEMVCDYVYYIAVFAGMSLGVYRRTSDTFWLWLGVATLPAVVLAFVFVARLKRKHARQVIAGEFYLDLQRNLDAQAGNPLYTFLRRHAFIATRAAAPYYIFLFALFDAVGLVLVIIFVGSQLAWPLAAYASHLPLAGETEPGPIPADGSLASFKSPVQKLAAERSFFRALLQAMAVGFIHIDTMIGRCHHKHMTRSVLAALVCSIGSISSVASAGFLGSASPRSRAHAASLEEAVAWIRDAQGKSVRQEYVMNAQLRLLFFWVGRDDVGGGYIQRAQGVGDPRLETIQVLFGSDPDKAPRRINRWGAATEVVRHREPGSSEIAASAFWGFMKDSRGKSVGEMEAELSAEETQKQFFFKANLSRVDPGRALSVVVPFYSDRDFNLHELEQAEPEVMRRFEADATDTRQLEPLPCARVEGFLFTIGELVERALAGARVPLSECYVYNARLYRATLIEAERIREKTVSVKLHRSKEAVKSRYQDLLSARFVTTDQQSGKKSSFELLVGASGPLRGIPVQIIYQPNWWFRVILNARMKASRFYPATE